MTKKLVIYANAGKHGEPPQLSGTLKSGQKVVFQKGEPPPQEVDVTFVVDTTQSMESIIEALLQTCTRFVAEANTLDLDSQYCVIAFGDIKVQGGGDTIQVVAPLTPDIEKIKAALKNMPKNRGLRMAANRLLKQLIWHVSNRTERTQSK